MCTRYRFTVDGTDGKMAAFIGAMERKFPGQYQIGDIGPGTVAPAMAERAGKIVAVAAAFGVPALRGRKLLLNARAETAARKPLFADGLRCRRILLPATGFYEWGGDARKTRHFFARADGRTFFLCGIRFGTGGLFRFVILTRPASEPVAAVHDRMPVIVGADGVRAYLTDFAAAERLVATASPKLEKTVCPGRAGDGQEDGPMLPFG